MDYTVHQTKAAIKSLIVACAPLAVVHDWWILGDDHKKWPSLLKSSADLDANSKERTHGYVIEFNEALPSYNERLGGSDTQDWTFTILGLHYHAVNDGVNHSSKLFLTEVMAIAEVFKRNPAATVAIPSELRLIKSYDFIHRAMPFGAEMCHAMEAHLTIKPC